MRFSRRDVLHAFGLGAAALPFVGCGSTNPGTTPDAPRTDAGPDANCVTWAAGGTAAMTARATYPDPFTAAVTSCPLVLCQTTAGPCTAPTTSFGLNIRSLVICWMPVMCRSIAS